MGFFDLQYPRPNQRLFSFKSVQLLDGPECFQGLTSFSVNCKVEGRDLGYSSGTLAVGRPRGNLKVEVKAKFFADSWFNWVSANPQFLDTEYNLSLVLAEGENRQTIDIIQLAWDEYDFSTEGTDASEVEMPGTAIVALINGSPMMGGDALGFIGSGIQFGLSLF